MAAQINNGIIRVAVENGCGQVFAEPYKIELYRQRPGPEILLAESTFNPAEFTGLDVAHDYVVKVVPEQPTQDRNFSVKDAYLLMRYILGLTTGNVAFGFAGDRNNDNRVNSIDLAL